MSTPATKWEVRRVETTRRLEWSALELTRDKGFDGWTMDDLATAAEVSRRTVFNYFDTKADLVLGPVHELGEEIAAAFIAGGPTGRLFDDLVHIANESLQENGADHELMQLRRHVMRTDPRVVAIAHERFEVITQDSIELILEREGASYGVQRARLLVQLLITIVDSVLERSDADLTRAYPDLINDAVSDARARYEQLTAATRRPHHQDPGDPMARLLYRLGSTAYRRWPLFIAGWLLFAVVLGSIAAAFAKPMSDEFTIPGIPSEAAADLQQELFPDAGDAFDDATVTVVVAAPEGHTLNEAPYADAIADLIAEIGSLPQLSDGPEANPGLVDPTVAAADAPPAFSPLSEDGRVGILSFSWDVDSPADIEPATIDAAEDLFAEHTDRGGDGFVVEANGPGMQSQSPPGGASELIGIGIALVVLLLTFGSAIAAGMPIITAIFGVGLGMTGITAMTALTDVGTSTPMLATMIGLAVGIDYTLFILARYRSELHHTDDRQHAAGIAVGTAGSAVVFAGLTVLIALSALAVVRIPFLTAMGLAAAATVLIAVLIALTLLPAILGMLKSWTFRGRVRRERLKRDEQGLIINNGVRWGRLVGRAPLAFVVVIVLGLGALALPISQMYLAFPTDSTAPTDTTRRQASDLIAEAFGPGREGPLLVVVDGRDIPGDQQRDAAFAQVADWAAGMDDVADAQLVATNAPIDPETGRPTGPATGAMIQVTPESGPDDEATLDLLQTLRDGQSDIEEQTGTTTGVTGLTAITTDVSDRLSSALPLYLLVVVGLAFILLMLVFRSILVPLTATLGFLLSVLATLGVTVAVFQEGALGIFEGQPIVSFMPIFLIGMVFGLAMDYQVFLVTRMREAHVHGLSTREAVVDGFRNSARVVVAAATIMIAVFSGFMLEDDAVVKSMGFALAASILFDAFIVRMALIPAVLYLLGERAWWLPAWLDRILPIVDVEGTSLERDSIPVSVADLDPDPDHDHELEPAV